MFSLATLVAAPSYAIAPQSSESLNIIDQGYVQAISRPFILKEAPESTYCSCIQFAKYTVGAWGQAWGNAADIPVSKASPSYGAIIVTNEGGGHVGVAVGVSSKSVDIIDANYSSCKRTERTLLLTEILGIYDYTSSKTDL